MVFHWSLSDSKSPQVSRTRLRILAVLSNAVIWIVSTRPPTSKSSGPFNNPLVIVPRAPITIGTIVTFMFHSFFNSLAKSRYLLLLSLFVVVINAFYYNKIILKEWYQKIKLIADETNVCVLFSCLSLLKQNFTQSAITLCLILFPSIFSGGFASLIIFAVLFNVLCNQVQFDVRQVGQWRL